MPPKPRFSFQARQHETIKMWVTLYTDASFKNDQGTWAVWIRSNQGRIVLNGLCPKSVTNSLAAEAFAIHKGIAAIIEELTDVIGIHINSDCLSLKTAFFPWGKDIKDKETLRIQTVVKKKIAENLIKIRFSHVKAHQRNDNVRSYLNNKCDLLAKKAYHK